MGKIAGVIIGSRPKLDRTVWPLLDHTVRTWLGIDDGEFLDGVFALDVSLAALEVITWRVKRWKLTGVVSSDSFPAESLNETSLDLIRNPYPDDPLDEDDNFPKVTATDERDIIGPAWEDFYFDGTSFTPFRMSKLFNTLRNQGFMLPTDAPDQPPGIQLFALHHSSSNARDFGFFCPWFPVTGPHTPTGDSYNIPGVLYDAETRLATIPCAMGVVIDDNVIGALASSKSIVGDDSDVKGHVTIRIPDFDDFVVPLVPLDSAYDNDQAAELLLVPLEWWSWGGRYDTTTGDQI